MALTLTNSKDTLTLIKAQKAPSLGPGHRGTTWDSFTVELNEETVTVHYETGGSWFYLQWGGQWYKQKRDKAHILTPWAKFTGGVVENRRGGNSRGIEKGQRKRSATFRLEPGLLKRLKQEENATGLIEELLKQHYGIEKGDD